MKQSAKLSTFFSLYLAQAVPLSLFSTLLPVLMRQEAFSLSAIGLLQLIKLPWILKFFWGPLVDKKTRSLRDFKGWILGSELVYAALILTIAFLNLKLNFNTVFVLMILAFVASATQDIATDALVALSFNKQKRGRGNSMQSMGNFAGTLVGAGLLMILFKHIGWTTLLAGVAVFLILAALPLLRFKQSDLVFQKTPTKTSFKDLGNFFAQKGVWKQVVFLFLVQSGIIGILAMYKPFLVDKGFKLQEIGLMFGVFGPVFGIFSSYVGGHLLQKWSRLYLKRFVGILVLHVPIFFLALTNTTPDRTMLYAFVAFMWTAYGFASVLVNTVAMDYVRPGREGTDFTLQTVLVHLSSMIVAVLSGKLSDLYGYAGLGKIEFLLALLSLTCILVWNKTKDDADGIPS
jgi:predicted MFS family arabinose efflux permease